MDNAHSMSKAISSLWQYHMEGVNQYSYGIYYKDMQIENNIDLIYSGASMIKPFILDIITHNIYQGKLRWTTPYTVQSFHKSKGDGLLQYWSTPITMTIEQLCHMMITISDNTATNALIDFLGGTFEVNTQLYSLGYLHTHLRSWVGGNDKDPNVDKYIPSYMLPTQEGISVVDIKEYRTCIRQLVQHPLCYNMLVQQQDNRSLSRHISGYDFAHKTGTADGLRHDGGIVYLPEGNLEVYCFTDGDERKEHIDDVACVNMSKAMCDTIYLLTQNNT